MPALISEAALDRTSALHNPETRPAAYLHLNDFLKGEDSICFLIVTQRYFYIAPQTKSFLIPLAGLHKG